MTFAAQMLVLSGAVLADQMSVVVNRAATHTEVYLSATAETLFRAIGADTQVIPMKSRKVDYAEFAAGTWGIGDALLADAKVIIDKLSVPAEAMSFMLHPSVDALPFETPLDGMIAIGVCNALSSDATYDLAELSGYVGYYIDQGSIDAKVELTFAASLEQHLTVHVFDHSQGHQSRTQRHFDPGSQVSIILGDPKANIRLVKLVPYGLLLYVAAAALKRLFRNWRTNAVRFNQIKGHYRNGCPQIRWTHTNTA